MPVYTKMATLDISSVDKMIRKESNLLLMKLAFLSLALTFRSCVRGDDPYQTETGQIQITGIEHKSIQLECPLLTSDPPRVRWLDYVYNSDIDPRQIYHSLNNSELRVDQEHPNRLNYEVNSNFTLTINKLKVDADPGEYFCESWLSDENILTQSYYVTVGGNPECSGGNPQGMRVGEHATLACEAGYSGTTQPKLTWYRDMLQITSDDEFDIRQAKQTVRFNVSHTDDDVLFTCVMEFGEVVDECSIRLHVMYPVHEISFYPTNRTHFSVGEQITCVARGNPTPRISVDPVSSSSLLRNGSRLIEIDRSWKEKNVTLNCSASNSIDGKLHHKYSNLVITVNDRPSPITSTSKPMPLPRPSKIDSNPGIVGGAIVVVALVLLAIIGAVVLVRKHRDKQRRKAAAAKAEANRNKEDQKKGQSA